MSSPADVIRSLLISEGLGAVPGGGGAWPIFVAEEPSSPDNAITLIDKDGKNDGRDYLTGQQWDHPGVEVRVRGVDHPTAYAKAAALSLAIDQSIYQESLTVGGSGWRVQQVSRSPIVGRGRESTSARVGFAFELTVTLTKEI